MSGHSDLCCDTSLPEPPFFQPSPFPFRPETAVSIIQMKGLRDPPQCYVNQNHSSSGDGNGHHLQQDMFHFLSPTRVPTIRRQASEQEWQGFLHSQYQRASTLNTQYGYGLHHISVLRGQKKQFRYQE